MAALPPTPAPYKALQHYIKTAVEHDSRDVVVAYYCRLYSLQRGMEIDKKSPDCRKWLMAMMDALETVKKAHPDMEAIHNEVVGQAHMEHYSLQMFLFADNEDRAGRFGKNVVKSFYTAGMLFDVLTTFGEQSEDIQKNSKYAKWKAAYIHRCLKNGETPIAGPLPEEGEEDDYLGAVGGAGGGGGYDTGMPQPGPSQHLPAPGVHAPPTTPSEAPHPAQPSASYQPGPSAPPPQRYQPSAQGGGVNLSANDYQKAMKFCKFAGSALQYEDSKTAIENLTKALNLLTTGHA